MAFQINYNSEELRAAAEFIWKNNPYAKNWAQSQFAVEQGIKDFIIDHAVRNLKSLENSLKLHKQVEIWDDWAGTGGYYITMYEDTELDEDDNRVGPLSVRVDILVDPAVGCDRLPEHYQNWTVDR